MSSLRFFIFFFGFLAFSLPGHISETFAQPNNEGRILEIKPDKSHYRIGDQIRVKVKIQSLQSGNRHHLVVLNILKETGDVIYDSHLKSENIEFLIRGNDTKELLFKPVNINHSFAPGVYHVLIGYREYPWEPQIAFRGTTWCLPIEAIRISKR